MLRMSAGCCSCRETLIRKEVMWLTSSRSAVKQQNFWRLKKRVHTYTLYLQQLLDHTEPRSSQCTVCILMLVLEEVWTGSGTSQQSIGDFWHHAHFAIIQLTADCGISERKLEVSSLKTSLVPLVVDCPGWHTSATLNGGWGQCPFLAELQRRSPFASHNPLEVVHTLWSPFSQIPNVHLKIPHEE